MGRTAGISLFNFSRIGDAVRNLNEIPLTEVKGIGEKKAEIFKKLNIQTVEDLFLHIPREYEDRSFVVKIEDIALFKRNTIRGRVKRVTELRPKPKMLITKALFSDETGSIMLIWYNQPYMKNNFRDLSKEYLVSGPVSFSYGELKIENPEMEPCGKEMVSAGIIAPIYDLTKGLTQKSLRKTMHDAIKEYQEDLENFIPEELIQKYQLYDKKKAIREIHFPEKQDNAVVARETLIFEELLLFQISIYLLRENIQKRDGILFHAVPEEEIFLGNLPFALTDSQKRVLQEIKEDLYSEKRMNRLLQGDVGSGKTVIAMILLLICAKNGYQGALMAPTEILAKQHYDNFIKYLDGFSLEIRLLVGSMSAKEKNEVKKGLLDGSVDLVIGTHALIQNDVEMKACGLVVTDEQHRFGVFQRYRLSSKESKPDILVMSATPIPRTLALTMYGDLDISTIDTLPPGRQTIDTYLVSRNQIDRVFRFIEKNVALGRQAYLVCPLILDSENLENVISVETLLQEVKRAFRNYQVGFLHGKMKADEKNQIMEAFQQNKIQILLSTTVIEVGIDVPNATVMAVFNAERFGLAQLHQLRGRVGRGSHKSACILVEGSGNQDSVERLKILTMTNNGLKVAEMDLERRGPGEFLGHRQHGLMEFKVADMMKNTDFLISTRKEAEYILKEDPPLKKPKYKKMKEYVFRKYRQMLGKELLS